LNAPPDDDPDLALLTRVGKGDAEAARAMVVRKLPRLLALATRMLGDPAEAEDVAQESFVRLWRQAGRWRAGGARFDTWLHRVALNLCYDRLRRRETAVEKVPERADPGPAPDQRLEEADTTRRVASALQALPDRQREAIVLAYYQGLSNIEAAEVMEISIEALESLLARARRRLRVLLKETGDER
jgi:RNA polymerase sigma-70 factor (ECF subfamily)